MTFPIIHWPIEESREFFFVYLNSFEFPNLSIRLTFILISTLFKQYDMQNWELVYPES